MNQSQNSVGILKNAALPLAMYAVLGALLFLDLPSRFRSPQHTPSAASAASVPNQPLSGGIYAPESLSRMVGQAGTHFRVDGWLGIRDPKLVVQRIVLMIDDRPVADAQLLMLQRDPTHQVIRCEWGNQLLLTGIEPGDHRLQMVAVLQDGSSIRLDEKTVMVLD